MSYEKSRHTWIKRVHDFKEYIKDNGKPSSLTKEGMKWYNWMNNQKIHYHKGKFHLKHEENRKIWEDLCKDYNIKITYKEEKIVQPKKKKDFQTNLEKISNNLRERNGNLHNLKFDDKYTYNWIRTQKKYYHNSSYVFQIEENRKLWERFCFEFKFELLKKKRNDFQSSCNDFRSFMKDRDGLLPQPEDKKWYNWLMVQKHKYRNKKYKKEDDLLQWKTLMNEFNINENRVTKINKSSSYKDKCNQYREFLLKKNISSPDRKSEDKEEKYWYGWVTNQRYNYENRKYRLDKDIYRFEWEKLMKS